VKFLSTVGLGRASVLGVWLTVMVSMGACDDASSSDAAACDPGAVCQCTKKSDCAATDDCVNNVCVPAGQITSTAATTAAGATTAGTTSTTGATTSTTTGTGGGAGAGSTGDAGAAGEAGSGGTGGGNSAEPSVVIVLDRSTSAAEDFDDGASRWEAIITALTEEDGPVEANAGSVALGVLDYTGFNGGTCPEFGDGVDPELDNYDAVSDYVSGLSLPEEDKSETPTREAIEQGVSMLSGASGPKAMILITDGVTDDTCMTFDNPNCTSQAYYAAQQAYTGGVRTYILGVSVFDDAFRQYLQGVANAGSGAPLQNSPEGCGPPNQQPETSDQGGTAPYWDANDTSEISSSLDEIFQAIRGE